MAKVTLIALAMLASPFSAEAALVATETSGAAAGSVQESFDSLTLGSMTQTTSSGITLSFVPDAGLVSGSLANKYAMPYLSGSMGAGFGAGGTAQPNGADTSTYLSTGSAGAFAGAQIRFALPTEASSFGLLWGSVDGYNSLAFYDRGTLVGTLTGNDVLAQASGDQGVGGTAYVSILSDHRFDTVVATSGLYAFEIDDVSFTAAAVAEPMSFALLGTSLIGVALLNRRRA